MSLPSNPPISLNQVKSEVGLSGTRSLTECLDASVLSDKSLPVPLTRFLGYSHVTIVIENFHAIGGGNAIIVGWAYPPPGVFNLWIQRRSNVNQNWIDVEAAADPWEQMWYDYDVQPFVEYQYRASCDTEFGWGPWVESNWITVDDD